jgi:hypothetical protein
MYFHCVGPVHCAEQGLVQCEYCEWSDREKGDLLRLSSLIPTLISLGIFACLCGARLVNPLI